jgi:hypothetical protein
MVWVFFRHSKNAGKIITIFLVRVALSADYGLARFVNLCLVLTNSVLPDIPQQSVNSLT